MKRIIRSVQTLGEQAARLSEAASQIPGRVAEIRESVAATTDQLQHLKSDIQMNVTELRVTSETQLAGALMEINSHTRDFENAGFELESIDLDLNPVQRLIVHFKRIGDADDDEYAELISRHSSQLTVKAILASLQKARQTADTLEMRGLDFDRVMIGIGNQPFIRLGWKSPSAFANAAPLLSATPVAAATSFFGGGESYFSKARVDEPISVAMHDSAEVAEQAVAGPAAQVVSEPPPLPVVTPPPLPVSTDPLARFKVMPKLGR